MDYAAIPKIGDTNSTWLYTDATQVTSLIPIATFAALSSCRDRGCGRPRSVNLRSVNVLGGDLPAWQTVYSYFRRWQRERTWERIHRYLRQWVRRANLRQSV